MKNAVSTSAEASDVSGKTATFCLFSDTKAPRSPGQPCCPEAAWQGALCVELVC